MAICAADCPAYVGNRLISEPTSRDEIERSVVIQEPISSILAIGQSIIVATQVRLRSGSAYQSVRSAESVSFASTEKENESQSTGWTVALISRPTQVSEFRQEKRSLAFVGSAATSCPDPNLARGLTRSVSDPHFSNSRGRVLVSERHRDIARRPNPVAPCTVSDGQGYSAATCNSVSGRTI